MFKLVNRSRSMRSLRSGFGGGGGNADADASHGPDSPVMGEPGFVSGSARRAQQNPSGRQNPAISSSRAPSPTSPTGSTYVRRPLPHPPSRPTAPAEATMDRPSTSAGPSSKGMGASGRNNFEKRVSRDDLYLNTQTSSRNFKSYHIPIRGKPPSPSATPPRSHSPETTIPVRTQTPDSMDGGRGGNIGMALGSPGYNATSDWRSQISRPIPVTDSYDDYAETVTIKQKTGRWKFFGGFGKKKQPEGDVFSPDNFTFESRPTTSAGNLASGLDRSNTDRRANKSKPVMVRSQTEPALESPMAEPRTPRMMARKSSNRSLRGEKVKKSDISAPMPIPAIPQISPPNLLDIEIPSIKMDRYSVMFSSILQGQNQSSQSNLLARRQATLDKLKTINDAIVKEEEEAAAKDLLKPVRRATSPMVSKSPSFSLFPAPPSNNKQVHFRLSPRSRSNTSPGLLQSPMKPTFETAREVRFKPIIASSISAEPAVRDVTTERRREPQLSQISQVSQADIPILLEPDGMSWPQPPRQASRSVPQEPESMVWPQPPTQASRPAPLETENMAWPQPPTQASRPVPRVAIQPAPQPAPQPAQQLAPQPAPQPIPEPALDPVAVPAPLRIPQNRKPVPERLGDKSYRRERPGRPSRPGTSDGPSTAERPRTADRPERTERERPERGRMPAPIPLQLQSQGAQQASNPPLAPQPQAAPPPADFKPLRPGVPYRGPRARRAVPEEPPPEPQQPPQPIPEPVTMEDQPLPVRPARPAQPKGRIPQPIQTQAKPRPNFGPGQSALILDSPTSETEDDVIAEKVRPTPAAEPPMQPQPVQAQVVSPPVSTASSVTSSFRKRSPSSASSVQTHLTKPSIDEPDTVLKNAVEISIARQISISQQQRQLLQPLQTTITRGPGSRRDTSSPASATAGRSPVRKVAMGRNERLAETRRDVPTLITPGSRFEQNRKSERIVVEGA